jgi:hypothetical protein
MIATGEMIGVKIGPAPAGIAHRRRVRHLPNEFHWRGGKPKKGAEGGGGGDMGANTLGVMKNSISQHTSLVSTVRGQAAHPAGSPAAYREASARVRIHIG